MTLPQSWHRRFLRQCHPPASCRGLSQLVYGCTTRMLRNTGPSEEDAIPTTSAATSSSTEQVAPPDCAAAGNAESSAGEPTQPSTADATSSETETLPLPLNVVSPRPKVVPRSKHGKKDLPCKLKLYGITIQKTTDGKNGQEEC